MEAQSEAAWLRQRLCWQESAAALGRPGLELLRCSILSPITEQRLAKLQTCPIKNVNLR